MIPNEEARKPLRLVVVSADAFASYELPPQGRVTIGRSDKSDLRIEDSSITRRHAILHVGSRIEVEDLGSVNGTRVREHRLVPGQRVEVFAGETFYLGTAVVMLQSPPAPGSDRSEDSEEVSTRRANPDAPAPRAARTRPQEVVANDPAMREVYALVDRIARGSISVLVLGETGVGKELVAERLHASSSRHARPFLRLNCASLAESLLESELFGHERGAFTGAHQTKLGLLESADGGTVFLDEIGEMPLAVQAKILRAIEVKQVTRVGGLAPRSIDVRFVAATNRDLAREVAGGRFREDLYFRLNAAMIVVPPLRSRVGDIEPLAKAFIASICHDMDHRVAPILGTDALRLLQRYAWPGNVRELRNFIERAVLLAAGPELSPEHFPLGQMAATLPVHRVTTQDSEPEDSSDDSEKERILRALNEYGGNQSRAAKALGIARSTLIAHLEAYGVPRPRK